MSQVNLFESIQPSTDPSELRAQHISTRLFLVLLITSLAILVLYTSTVRIVKTVTVRAPTHADYTDLYQQHPQTLSCPCTQISVAYSTFLEINHTLHPVCDSVYVTDEFITYLVYESAAFVRRQSFRLEGVRLFQALKSLCLIAQDWISTNLAQFYLSNYIGTSTASSDLFESQSAALVQQFIASATKSFFASLQIVRNITQANGLLDALFHNYNLSIFADGDEVVVNAVVFDDNCRCDRSNKCVTRIVMFLNESDSSPWIMPGLYAGCYVLEALLQSHLGCFFDELCLETLQFPTNPDLPWHTSALDQAKITKFVPNTSVGAILDKLMVDAWNWSAVHSNYFAACKPKECSYTMTGRNAAIYIVTTVIGLIGGLVTAFKFVIPRLVSLSFYIIKRRRRNMVMGMANRGRNGVRNLDQIRVSRAW